ncbi:MAG: electron transport complex subunit RsxC [Aristaeellaceae bacterium]
MFGSRLFPGGVHPHEGVSGKRVNGGNAIKELPAPPRLVIPLQQHIGAPAKAVVSKGDRVLKGQVIGEAGGFVSAPVHSSVSGVVVDVQPCLQANGTEVMAVIIDNDYQDEWVELHPAEHPETLTAAELQKIIREAGIVGMGGATFPTSVKLTPPKGKTIEKLIINGAECEPYLTADHRLMLEKASEIIDGVRLIMLALDIRETIIGVEDNKPDAISVLSKAAQGVDGVTVRALPVRYPQGGEKQLIYATTKRKVPCGALPIEVGCAVCNVATVYAIQQAVRLGKPLIERVTTVGGMVNNPGNYMVRIGTPIENLLDACGGLQTGVRKLISGGPMMGMSIARTDIPITKGSSGILALGREALNKKESPCIRCGRCMRACPMQLMPAKLDALVRADKIEMAEKFGVMNCLECGACTFACPAKRELTQSCRAGKKIINTRRRQAAARKAAEEAAAKAAEQKKEG